MEKRLRHTDSEVSVLMWQKYQHADTHLMQYRTGNFLRYPRYDPPRHLSGLAHSLYRKLHCQAKSSGNRIIHVSKFEIKKGMYFLSPLVLCRDKEGASSMVFKRAV